MAFDFSANNLDIEFPVRKSLVYFNHAAVAPLPRRVAERIVAHTENVRDRGAANWRDWDAGYELAREKVASFLGARPSEIAFVPSTSWGLNLVALGLPWREGDNAVSDDMEFPANVYPWMNLASRGVEYRAAGNRDGRVTAEAIAAQVDVRTRLVALSWVAFHNGFVYPIGEIGAFCRERGILLVVDAIQGLGMLPIDVSKSPIDVLVADAHKWLLGPEACAVFYVAESARERLPPAAAGWWNIRKRENYLDYALDFYEGGRRYEAGSLPTAQIDGLAAAVDLLSDMGIETVRDRILTTAETLKHGLEERGWRITSPQPLRSGILAAIPPKGDPGPVARALEERGIFAAPREGAVRFSPHAYNDEEEVEEILETVDEIL